MTFEQWHKQFDWYSTRSKTLTERELLKEAYDAGREEERLEIERSLRRRNSISEFEDSRD